MSGKNKLSYYLVFLLCALIIVCSFCHNNVAKGSSRVITWDVYGYYLYLPAVFIYRDTKEYHFATEHLKTYQPSSDLYQLKPVGNKLLAPGYTMGLAILWLPFFLLAHTFVCATHFYAADGMSFPYQLAIIIASWFYVVIGLYFLRKALLRFFSDRVTALTMAVIVLGTNYFHYACFESGMPHATLFSLYAVLIYCVSSWYERPNVVLSAAIGFLTAIACLCRPSEIVAVLFFILFGLQTLNAITQRPKYLWHHRAQIFTIVVAGAIMLVPQLLYWHYSIGKWIYNGYYDHTFTFLKPQLLNGLFSYRKGWLVYTPVMFFALAGFFTRRLRQTGLLYAVLAYFIVNIYIVFSWDTWWYASSFGSRALVQSYALLSLPFASFLFTIQPLRWAIRIPVILLVLLGVCFNQFQDWQYLHGILPKDETTKIYYWKIFGKTDVVDPHLKRFLDIDEELPAGKTYLPVLLNGGCSDSINKVVASNTFGSSEIVPITAANAQDLSQKWLRVEANVRACSDLCTPWHEAMLVVTTERAGKSIKWSNIRFQGQIKPGLWDNVGYEIQLPLLQPGDELKAFIWNQGPDTILQYCIKLEALEEQK